MRENCTHGSEGGEGRWSFSTPIKGKLQFVFVKPSLQANCAGQRACRNWQNEEALDALIDQLEAGRVTHKQALMQARKLEATTPDNLEIHNLIANRLWALGLQDESAEV